MKKKGILVESQDVVDAVFNDLDWEEAFVREAYMISPSYVVPGRMMAPHAKPTAFVLIVIPEDTVYGGIELIFEEVSCFSCSFSDELNPSCKVSKWNTSVEFQFVQNTFLKTVDIYAERMAFRLLEKAECGSALRYGLDNPFDH